MNWDRIQGNWKQVVGKAKAQWGKLTDDDLDVVAGRREQLAGKIQERYGIAKDDVEQADCRLGTQGDRCVVREGREAQLICAGRAGLAARHPPAGRAGGGAAPAATHRATM